MGNSLAHELFELVSLISRMRHGFVMNSMIESEQFQLELRKVFGVKYTDNYSARFVIKIGDKRS